MRKKIILDEEELELLIALLSYHSTMLFKPSNDFREGLGNLKKKLEEYKNCDERGNSKWEIKKY